MALRAETNVRSHHEMPTWLDGQTGGNWLPMRKGIENLSALLKSEADILVPHTPHYFSANVLPNEFNSLAECPKWLTLLNRNHEGDQQRIALLQQYYGYYLAPTLSAQKFIPPRQESNSLRFPMRKRVSAWQAAQIPAQLARGVRRFTAIWTG